MQASNAEIVSIQSQLADYFEYLAARMERLARLLPPEKLWKNPFGFGNSVGNLIVHLTGSMNHFIGAGIGGSGYVRNRPAEFSEAVANQTADEILAAFRECIALVVQTLRAQTAQQLVQPVTNSGNPVQNRFGMFMVSAGHISNHMGQIVYLLHAHGIQFDDRSW